MANSVEEEGGGEGVIQHPVEREVAPFLAVNANDSVVLHTSAATAAAAAATAAAPEFACNASSRRTTMGFVMDTNHAPRSSPVGLPFSTQCRARQLVLSSDGAAQPRQQLSRQCNPDPRNQREQYHG
ncbi:uncharacterized protein SPSK_10658 [Sporothrix schenckii 1099-18]|uniref:Uncharacterized protein n=1 Tax=Sporothrix schenckii 1099-18 TaxID=1397361 RepID=A0A0F2LRN4_SPOSC|nr:uncharacterized protein SPSK_10658 [Sporothrix schenckii 1099-18]KJR80172.1 hypothetical protein SPSK_10658 [Sporothrix schenckii 1099-18]